MKNKITWKTEKRKVKDLIPADYNPRKITDKQREELAESIKEYDQVVPVVINTNNRMIGGHQRLSIYADLEIEEIEVRVPNRQLTLEEEKRLNLRLNKNTGDWDTEKLQLFEIETLLEVGFGDEELSSVWDNVEITDDNFNTQKAIEEAKTTTVKAGDIYELGNHRLMCGNSTDGKDVEKLMAENIALMVYCDPPYNIGLDYEKGVSTKGKYGGHARKEAENDEYPELKYKGVKINDRKGIEEYGQFLEATINNAIKHSQKNAHYFYWCDENNVWLLQQLFSMCGISPKRVCMWIKNNFNMTPQIAFNKVYEPCVYGIRGRPFLNPNYKNLNEIMNREVESGNQVHDEIFDLFNLWLVRRDNAQQYEHPIQKPITLNEKPIKRCTGPGAVILDLFGGSGSTLLAAEQLNRKAFLMEISPIFCQVIINRWQDYTGKKAKKIN